MAQSLPRRGPALAHHVAAREEKPPESRSTRVIPDDERASGRNRIVRVNQEFTESPAPVPPPPQPGLEPVQIPWEGENPADVVNLTTRNGRITLVAREAPVQTVLNLLAQQQGLSLMADEEVAGNISLTLNDVPFEDALNSIVDIAGCTWTQQRGIVIVTRVAADSKVSPHMQGRVVQVFPLNFISATEVEATIKGLLSPIGQVFTSQASPTDKRRTQELVVVEDIPTSLCRIEQYILQVDQPPRQVLIEAHILQVDLKDEMVHGINWKYLNEIAGSNLLLSTQGFANPLALPGSVMFLTGDRTIMVLEALKTTTDAKTLASPNVIVANGQEARIQIGSKLGYFVTTTTQTSTLQNVNFLNAGVLLRVTPIISNDDRVLLNVRPEVSTGKINLQGLPETQTTEAETTVLLNDGGGMVIGGLIKESSLDTQDKVPLLGDIWGVGRLFQRRQLEKQRSEIVIVLIPKIAPYSPHQQVAEDIAISRAVTPVFQNGLRPNFRPFDDQLPDAVNNPRRLRFSRLKTAFRNPYHADPKPLNYYFPATAEEGLPVQDPNVFYGPDQPPLEPAVNEVPIPGSPAWPEGEVVPPPAPAIQ